MKKIVSFCLAALAAVAIAVLLWLDRSGAVSVEQTVADDKACVEAEYPGKEYVWYETMVALKDSLRSGKDAEVDSVINVFQVNTPVDSVNLHTEVLTFTHKGDSVNVEHFDDLWIEDFPLVDAEIKVTFMEAYELLMETNIPKPRGACCVLRKMTGPIEANPQYIFGTMNDIVFVDAVTGKVSDVNPSFNPDSVAVAKQ